MNSSRRATFEDLKCFNMEAIKGIHWAESMFEKLDSGFKKSFLNWINIVLALSQNEDDIKEWKNTFMEQFEERCCEMVCDMQDLHEQVVHRIEENLQKTQVLCKTLQIEMPVLGRKKLGLYQEQLQLKRCIKEMEQLVETRQKEVNKLREKQLSLCQSLGKEPRIICNNHLPSSNEIMEFQKYVEYLEDKKFKREEEFYVLKEQLLEIIKELEYVPKNTFERDVLSDDSKLIVTTTNMKSMKKFLTDLKKKLEDVKEECSQLRNKIEGLWSLLNFEFTEMDEFRNKFPGNSLKTLEALRNELDKCNKIKKANIKVFVEKLRKKLIEIWEMCHCTEEVKSEFKFFFTDCYSEDLLELHEIEIEKWRKYADENKEILNLLNKHKSLWDKMVELERSANGADRYNNRGGKLLQEEKERNLLSKQIPKIESKLLELSEQCECRHGTQFLNYGAPVADYINNLHCDWENDKKQQLSARKAQATLTPHFSIAKSCTTLFPSNTTSKRQMECPATDVAKKVKMTPRKILTEPRSKRRLNIPKVLVNDNTLSTIGRKRKSQEKRKQIIKNLKRISKNLEDTNSSTYGKFENEISKVGARSTLNFASTKEEEVTELAQALTATPGTSHVRKTPIKFQPKSPKSTTKSPIMNSKLSTAKTKTKLIF